ncbi:MAG: ABC transporter substrate-binding protein [Bacteroidales bacterium]|nr:ABC transporter substrate-binding protein [Bacteroidales bacterium]
MKKTLFLIISLFVLVSCVNRRTTDTVTAHALYHELDSAWMDATQYSDTIEIRYAKGLQVSYEADGIHVSISNPDPSAKYGRTEEYVIKESKHRFICTTALQLGNFEALGLEERIVGMNSLRNLFSPKMKEQMKSGQTVMIGKEGNFDIETVIACRPDFIFVSASKHGGFEALKDCGIPLISHHGYKESHPLGQAEWIKLIGLLTGETQRANAVFDHIEKEYLALKKEVSELVSKEKMPTIISGRQIRDGWYIVGGKSYMAQIFKDAGADYIMKDNEDSGGTTLDFETVYARGIHADFWQIDGSFDGEFTLEILSKEDDRYATMDAYKKKQVLFCNLAETPYRELAGVQPQLVLADFVKVLHPELLKEYKPMYYKKVKSKE